MELTSNNKKTEWEKRTSSSHTLRTWTYLTRCTSNKSVLKPTSMPLRTQDHQLSSMIQHKWLVTRVINSHSCPRIRTSMCRKRVGWIRMRMMRSKQRWRNIPLSSDMVKEAKFWLRDQIIEIECIILIISRLISRIWFLILGQLSVQLTSKWDMVIQDLCLEDKKLKMFQLIFKNLLEAFMQSNSSNSHTGKTELLKTVKYQQLKGAIGACLEKSKKVIKINNWN